MNNQNYDGWLFQEQENKSISWYKTAVIFVDVFFAKTEKFLFFFFLKELSAQKKKKPNAFLFVLRKKGQRRGSVFYQFFVDTFTKG